MADETDPIEQSEESNPGANQPSGLMTVITLACLPFGCLFECIQTIHNPRPLRISFAVAYGFAAMFMARYAIQRTFLNKNPPVRWKKGDPKLFYMRILVISATLLMMGCVLGNLIPSAGSTWKALADDAFPWLFVLNCQPAFLTERIPVPPTWPQSPLGKFLSRMRRAVSRRQAGATQQ